MLPVEMLVEQAKKFGITLCADMDEDCGEVEWPYECWLHEQGTGFCPYAAHIRPI
jgi:hypothetical protein